MRCIFHNCCNKTRQNRIYINENSQKAAGLRRVKQEGYAIEQQELTRGTDVELVAALRRGKRSALEQAISRYGAYVAAVVTAQLGSGALREDVEELASDVFLTLWKNRTALKTERLRGWLGTVARNTARGFLRKNGAAPQVLPAEDYLCVQDEQAPRLLAQQERQALVRRLLDTLEAQDREIFLRYYYYNQTTAAIAAQMQMTDSTVRSRLLRGRKRLRELLEQGGYSLEDSDF